MKTLFTSILLSLVSVLSYADVVARPQVERLVNDFANILSADDINFLEDSLVNYANRTSNQIVILTVNDLDGYDPADYAYRVGQTWGVGTKANNNGVVILVKPKLSESDRGQAFIAPGYGLEGVLPDITCSSIVRDEMIRFFRNDDYAVGIFSGAVAVMKACEGEYVASGSPEDELDFIDYVVIAIMIAIILWYLWSESPFSSGGGGYYSSRGSGWGSFSSGSGSFSSGGFGGFGGGSFGGGGGGGSW